VREGGGASGRARTNFSEENFNGALCKKREHHEVALAALLTSLSAMSAEAYTCADVRSLSLEQQAYYVRALDITPAEQERIRHACYGPNTRSVTTSVEVSISHFGQGGRDTRIGQ
jgi:hypothetical protein